MNLIATDNVLLGEKNITQGETFDAPDDVAQKLIDQGVAKSANGEAANTAGPLDGSAGGQDGAASSSPQAPAQTETPQQPPAPNGFPTNPPQQPTQSQIDQDMAKLNGPSLG